MGNTTLRYLAFLQLFMHAMKFSSSVQTFNGVGELVIEGQARHSLPDDFVTDLEASLRIVLSGDIEDVQVLGNISAESGCVTISFRGNFEDFESVPVCLRSDSFYYQGGTFNLTYSIQSLSIQNFPNSFDEQCINDGKGVAYFKYMEQNCQFPNLHCEARHNLQRLCRYELRKSGSVFYSFFCVNPNDVNGDSCVEPGGWVVLQWEQGQGADSASCAIQSNSFSASSPSFAEFENDWLGSDVVHIDTLPLTLDCPTTTFGIPVILLYGDQTWNKLPDWMQVCLRALNGVSLTALLFCLITFSIFKELRNTHGKNVLSLVFAGMLSLFYTSGYIPLMTENRHLCVFVATLIYYFVLVPTYWWTAVAIFLAWTFGRKGIHRTDEVSGARFFLLLSLFGWGVPLLFALLVLFLHVGGIKVFDIDEYCWIIQGWPNYLISAQTFLPFFVDCLLFVLVIYRLRATRRELAHLDANKKSTVRNERQRTIKIAAIFGVFLATILDHLHSFPLRTAHGPRHHCPDS